MSRDSDVDGRGPNLAARLKLVRATSNWHLLRNSKFLKSDKTTQQYARRQPSLTCCLLPFNLCRMLQLRAQFLTTDQLSAFWDIGLNKDDKMVAPAVPEYVKRLNPQAVEQKIISWHLLSQTHGGDPSRIYRCANRSLGCAARIRPPGSGPADQASSKKSREAGTLQNWRSNSRSKG